MANIISDLFGTPEKHYPPPSVPPKLPEYPSGKTAEGTSTIVNPTSDMKPVPRAAGINQ